MNILRKFDKTFEKVEKIGFKIANFSHQMIINGILIGIGYTIYSSLRDYNTI